MPMNKFIRILLIALSILVAGLIIYWLGEIVTYILIAWVVSMIGTPIMDFFFKRLKVGKYRANNIICAILTLLILISVFTSIAYLFIPIILEQVTNLAKVDVAAIVSALEEPISKLQDLLMKFGLIEQTTSTEQQIQDELSRLFQPTKISSFLGSIVSLVTSLSIGIFSVIFISFFFLKERGLFTLMLTNFSPSTYEGKVRIAVEEISDLLSRYFTGVLLQIFIISIYLGLLLSLIGVKNALLIAVFAAFINVIPYLGPIIGATFGVMLTITASLELDFYNEMMPLLVKVVACFVSMQLLDNFILQPTIFSNRVRAHPLEIFLIIMIGAKAAGIVGMILAIPAYTVIRVIAKTFLSEFEVIQKVAVGLKKNNSPSEER